MSQFSTAHHYFPDVGIRNESNWEDLPDHLNLALANKPLPKDTNWEALLAKAGLEGVTNYLTYANPWLKRESAYGAELRSALLRGEADKLSGDRELTRLFTVFEEAHVGLILLKGEALARSIYPSRSCRPSGDFDVLVNPLQLDQAEGLLIELGYEGGRFEGMHMSGQRTWINSSYQSGRPFVIDCHWDITNRRFFRNRLSFSSLFSAASRIPLEPGFCTIPSPTHSLIIACVHLAAAEPHMPIELRWLLDIRMLLDALGQDGFAEAIHEAKEAGLHDVLATYCALTLRILGVPGHERQIEDLFNAIDQSRRGAYRRCCESRFADFREYFARLDGYRQKLGMASEAVGYTLKRLIRKPALEAPVDFS